MDEVLSSLRKDLARSSVILTGNDVGFKDALQRWSDFNTQTPFAIIQSSNEGDVVKTVSYLQGTE